VPDAAPLSTSEVQRLRELLEKATPGPWAWCCEDWSMTWLAGGDGKWRDEWILCLHACRSCFERAKKRIKVKAVAMGRAEYDTADAFKSITGCTGPWNEADRALIVEARNALPSLLAAAEENERLREHLREVKKVLGTIKRIEDSLLEDDAVERERVASLERDSRILREIEKMTKEPCIGGDGDSFRRCSAVGCSPCAAKWILVAARMLDRNEMDWRAAEKEEA
jgi:hypothetical protein